MSDGSQSRSKPRLNGGSAAVGLPAAEFSVVGIGASAGGLEAARKLVAVLPAGHGMALILVQHLDPNHESMMADLLAGYTAMPVREAADGMAIEPDHLYVIPPGTCLAVADGVLRLSPPKERHGVRLPFDFLLNSLAAGYGARAIAVVLSGTGADGSVGLRAVAEHNGLVVAQDPDEAEYDGMPRNAILTGAVNLVLPVAEIPAALLRYDRRIVLWRSPKGAAPSNLGPDWLAATIAYLRANTAYDFSQYKQGTLQRRIERRMAMAAIKTDDADSYIDLLRNDPRELELLANDLLINVTGFFRDPRAFDLLAERIVPDLVRQQPADQPLRIWIAGCSTGEEAYSLAMVFREAIAAAQRGVKLQVFASDVDPDAIATAKEGFYPDTIESVVSPARLARFFQKDGSGYRVSPALRADVIFAVQDVLADPPFAQLDFVSCRNLLIYLRPEAQAKVVSLFHFALREGGIMLLGGAETAGNVEGRFEVVSKADRLYRHTGGRRKAGLGLSLGTGAGIRVLTRGNHAASRRAVLADLCRQLVLDAYAPAAVLINRRFECLHFLGPTENYLRVAPGAPSHDLLAMASATVRSKLRAALQQASESNARTVVPGGRKDAGGVAVPFNIDVRPVHSEGEDLLLVCFVDAPQPGARASRPTLPEEAGRVTELEHELGAAKADLESAIRNLEISGDDQQTIIEEALSVNEEYQSTNEELMTSKEELQSLNEELGALNSQLHESLEAQRTTASDLKNVLYSTNVATVFLDRALNIRLFTPATRSLFSIIPADIGRPLADLHSLAVDAALLPDARAVLRAPSMPVEREIETEAGIWFIRRVLPYRAHDDGVEGVVITFTDITEAKRIAKALEAAKHQAELATIAKSRFLAVASHDLRQPLQTLALLQGLLAKVVAGGRGEKLVVRLDETVGAMAGMLNTLLDINQIEAGTVTVETGDFPVNVLLERLRDEFTYLAQANDLSLRVVKCGLSVRSDPRLLEQMLRNLLSNALKYTTTGKVVLGCRRRGATLAIEIWDTGVGIAEADLEAIFEEYRQLNNPAREGSRGLGLGLSIVQRLGLLLGHDVHVRSWPGRGSMFSVAVKLQPSLAELHGRQRLRGGNGALAAESIRRTGAILVVEDDQEVRELLELLLTDDGHDVAVAPDGAAALKLVTHDGLRPDLILSDYNLPGGLNGVEVVTRLAAALRRHVPAIILTGDISTGTLREIALQNCTQLNKPVKVGELIEAVQRLLPAGRPGPAPGPPVIAAAPPASMSSMPMPPMPPMPRPPAARPSDTGNGETKPVIFVDDDDSQIRMAIRDILKQEDRVVADFADCEAFLQAYVPGTEGCLLIDAYLPGMTGLELLRRLREAGHILPAVMITGFADVAIAVEAMKAGALDFIEKPISNHDLLASVDRALEQSRDSGKQAAARAKAAKLVAGLTDRQREIMNMVLAGHPSKNIAADLGISQRTVENHRASIMQKTGAKSLPALARLALAATRRETGEATPEVSK